MSEEEKHKIDVGAENKFSWKHFYSVLKYYYHMKDDEINAHSYPYLLALYTEYPKRACENLGVPSEKKKHDFNKEIDTENLNILSDDEYPEELKVLLQEK